MEKKKFDLYPPLPPLSLISLSPRSPLSQPPLMRKQYNFNTEHGRQLGGEKADFPRSFIEREFRTCPFHLFLDLHLSLFLHVRDILAHCCSPIQKTKKGWGKYHSITSDKRSCHSILTLPSPCPLCWNVLNCWSISSFSALSCSTLRYKFVI